MLLSEFINLKEKPGCNMTEEGRGCAVHGMNECPGYKMIETSAQEKLHQQHQEIRKKSGLPNPNYYKELRATFDLPDKERQAAVAAIKKKYKIKEQNVSGISAGDNAAYANYADTRAKGDLLGKEMDPGRETGIKTITSPEYKSAVSNMTTGLAAQNPEMEKRYQMNKLTAPKPTYGASAAQLESEDLEEAGPFSYGAKKPRKGSVADLAAKKRKEQEKDKQPAEPRDHMVGVAKVIKGVAEGSGITKLNDYNQWSDQVDAQGAEKHMQKNRTLIVAQSWDGERVGEFDTRSNQGWVMTQGISEGVEQYLEELSRAGYEVITETAQLCPECGGPAFADQVLAEKKDACYSKVKSRYKVWPSAYASGALVRCRKVGAKNWGNKSKK